MELRDAKNQAEVLAWLQAPSSIGSDIANCDLLSSILAALSRMAELGRLAGLEEAVLFLRDHKVILDGDTWKVVNDPLTDENDLTPIQMAMILAIRALCAKGGK